jgi:hypothetical protein
MSLIKTSDNETRNIVAMLIMEVIGKPPEHLTETLDKMIKEIDEEKGAKVIEKKIHDPVPMKEKSEFFTSFAEIEVEVEEILVLSQLMFKYMPAHVEIIHPELIALTNNGWTEILSETIRKLHGYDEVARVIETQKKNLEEELKKLKENNSKEESKE